MQLNISTPPLNMSRIVKFSLVLPMVIIASLISHNAQAQGLFAPAIIVNTNVVTNYEIEQRAQLYRLLRNPGDPVETARTELMKDRLKNQATREAGIKATSDDIKVAIQKFAKQANMTDEQLIKALSEGGVEPETFRDFIQVSLEWGDFVRARFLSRSRPDDAEIDRALGRVGNGGGMRVLLSEIIIPINAQNAPQVEELVDQLAKITSVEDFANAAAQYSATDTRTNGGRMDWLPITNLPPDLRPVILALRPGEVSSPISLPNAVALFQMRDVQEITGGTPKYSAIEYAKYYIPGGRSEAALKTAAEISNHIDRCDDLYGIAKDQPAEVLERESLPSNKIPRDIALELAKLDEGEISTNLTSSNGQNLILLMLCGRSPVLSDDEVRTDLINGLIQQRLNAFSDSYLDQLQADALIIEK
ncbi:MAG: peptidylprolyl isomerase [Rhodobacteraceae bacterium]|nr:peptidylprolyl isomerase [Paracoccaceae bacterium]